MPDHRPRVVHRADGTGAGRSRHQSHAADCEDHAGRIRALLPLALAIGLDPEMQQLLAIVILSGLAVQLPRLLLLMPALAQGMRHRNSA